MTDTPPGVEPKVPVSVVCETAGGGASVREAWDRIVSDLSGNDAGPWDGSCCLVQGTVGNGQRTWDYDRSLEGAGPVFVARRAVSTGGPSHTPSPTG